jgi:hypothetical protein
MIIYQATFFFCLKKGFYYHLQFSNLDPTNPKKIHLAQIDFKLQGVFESCAKILTTRSWLHVELGKTI